MHVPIFPTVRAYSCPREALLPRRARRPGVRPKISHRSRRSGLKRIGGRSSSGTSFVGAPDWGLNWGLNRRFSIVHHIIWIMLRKLAYTSHILLLWQDVYAWRNINLLLTFIIQGFKNGTRKKTKSLWRFEVAHKETSNSNWNWPTSYSRSPCCIAPKAWVTNNKST